MPEDAEAVKPATGTVDSAYVYWSADEVADVPKDVVTVTSTTAPAVALAGAMAVIELSLTNVYDDAAVLSNVTPVTPVKPLPDIVTVVPPAVVPVVGEMPVTTGVPAAAVNVNWSADEVADVPPAVVTVTSTVPAEPAGAVAVIELSLTNV